MHLREEQRKLFVPIALPLEEATVTMVACHALAQFTEEPGAADRLKAATTEIAESIAKTLNESNSETTNWTAEKILALTAEGIHGNTDEGTEGKGDPPRPEAAQTGGRPER